jgi:hypothetical protein
MMTDDNQATAETPLASAPSQLLPATVTWPVPETEHRPAVLNSNSISTLLTACPSSHLPSQLC